MTIQSQKRQIVCNALPMCVNSLLSTVAFLSKFLTIFTNWPSCCTSGMQDWIRQFPHFYEKYKLRCIFRKDSTERI